MTRVEQMLAALAQGDADITGLLDRMQGTGWRPAVLRRYLGEQLQARTIFVSDLGSVYPKRPRVYTPDITRAVAVPPRKPQPDRQTKPQQEAHKLAALALQNRSELETTWARIVWGGQ